MWAVKMLLSDQNGLMVIVKLQLCLSESDHSQSRWILFDFKHWYLLIYISVIIYKKLADAGMRNS